MNKQLEREEAWYSLSPLDFQRNQERKTQVSPCSRQDMIQAPGSCPLCPGAEGEAPPAIPNCLHITTTNGSSLGPKSKNVGWEINVSRWLTAAFSGASCSFLWNIPTSALLWAAPGPPQGPEPLKADLDDHSNSPPSLDSDLTLTDPSLHGCWRAPCKSRTCPCYLRLKLLLSFLWL